MQSVMDRSLTAGLCGNIVHRAGHPNACLSFMTSNMAYLKYVSSSNFTWLLIFYINPENGGAGALTCS